MKYLIYGQDSYRAREFIRSLSDKVRIVDQPEHLDSAVLNLAQPNLFGAAEPVVFRNILNQLDRHTPALINPSARVIIWEEKDQVKPPSGLKSHFQLQEFKPLSLSQARQWLDEQAQAHSLAIERRLLARLVDLHGANLHLLSHELAKLSLYCRNKGSTTLSPAEFSQLCHPSTEESIFNLLDAFGERRLKAVQTSLAKLLAPGVDEWYLFYLLAKHLRQLCQIKLGVPTQAHPYVIKKLTQQARSWDQNHLVGRLRQLLQLELHIKKGQSQLKPELVNWIFHTI